MQYGWNPANISDVPLALQAWVSKPQNLTQTLRLHGLAIELVLLNQVTAALPPAEAQLLKHETGLIRQIYLKDPHQVFTYGRTIIPQTTLTAYADDFAKLGNKPIGEALLYNKPNVQRSAFEFGYVLPGSLLFHDAIGNLPINATKLWARRSFFSIADFPLLITELFFPELPTYALPDHSA